MSQHYFSTSLAGRPVTVLLGWDRPLGHLFMVVELDPLDGEVPCEPEDAGLCLYSYLQERDAFTKDQDHYKRKLVELGIQVPEAMWAQVDLDRRMDIGNRWARYAADGTFIEA